MATISFLFALQLDSFCEHLRNVLLYVKDSKDLGLN